MLRGRGELTPTPAPMAVELTPPPELGSAVELDEGMELVVLAESARVNKDEVLDSPVEVADADEDSEDVVELA